MRFTHRLCISIGLLFPLAVCSCEPPPNDAAMTGNVVPADKQQDVELECHFFYRTSTRTSEGEHRQLTVTVPFLQGDIPEISPGITEQITFNDLACTVSAEYNSLVVHFLDPADPISTLLYQFDDEPGNGLTAGHGFTGLHSLYHPESEAEIQFRAIAKEPDPRQNTE